VRIDVEAIGRGLTQPSAELCDAWLQARRLMLRAAGQSTFDIWLAPLELIAVDSKGALVVIAPALPLSWVHKRFGPLIANACQSCGQRMRFASPSERLAIDGLPSLKRSSDEEPTINRRVS
jgi:DnaA N-terminal domain